VIVGTKESPVSGPFPNPTVIRALNNKLAKLAIVILGRAAFDSGIENRRSCSMFAILQRGQRMFYCVDNIPTRQPDVRCSG